MVPVYNFSLSIFAICRYLIFLVFLNSLWFSLIRDFPFKTVALECLSVSSSICASSGTDSVSLFFPVNGPYFSVSLYSLNFIVDVVENWPLEFYTMVNLEIRFSRLQVCFLIFEGCYHLFSDFSKLFFAKTIFLVVCSH